MQEQANRIGYNSKSRRLLEALPTEFDWDLIFSKMDNDENKTRVAMMMSVKSHLRVTEFMLFFWKLCNADYGKVFGSVDASYILTAFKSFLKERTNELSQYAVTSTEDVDVSIDSHVIRPQELWRMAMKGELAPDVADGVLDMLGPYDERGNLLPSSKRRPR